MIRPLFFVQVDAGSANIAVIENLELVTKMSLIAQLNNAELARVRFHLECDDAFAVETATLLRLRRPLLRAARWAHEVSDPTAEAMLHLLDAPPPVDPVLRRRVQKPSP